MNKKFKKRVIARGKQWLYDDSLNDRRVTAIFKDKKGVLYAKGYTSYLRAQKAEKGLKKVGSKLISIKDSKGFKFGSLIKRLNRKK